MIASEKLLKNSDIELKSLEDKNPEENQTLEVINYDQAVERAGGFGKPTILQIIGAFHAYFFIFVIFTMTSNGFLFYALPFLELFPAYICPNDIPECTHRDRCLNK
jgi:hypothetical protein